MRIEIFIGVYLLGILLNAIWHGTIWRNKGFVPGIHKAAANGLKFFLWATLSILWYNQFPFSWANVFPVMVIAFFFMGSLWWMLFDLLVNLIGGKHIFHMGKTAATDRAFPNYPVKMLAQVLLISFLTIWLLKFDSLI